MAELPQNSTLSHYRIVSKIGAGGMGEVYLAQDTKLDRKVAIKILPQEFAKHAERMRRFVQEAKAASALNHPNIITIHEIGVDDGTHFIAIEYIEGETLSRQLRRESLSLKSALEVAIQIASALHAAHNVGIIHRDLKPENVMIRPDGVVKLLDFGIAKLSEQPSPGSGIDSITDEEAATTIKVGTSPGVIIGTAAYMSPEQARGKPVDARTDIFSFGVVLYEMLSARQPFEGETAMDVIGAILNKEPTPIRQLLPDIPPDIERLVTKTLRKDREERYQVVKDLLIDLKDAKQELELQGRLERTTPPDREESKTQLKSATTAGVQQPPSSAEYVVAEIKSHKLFFGVGLLVFLLAATGLGHWFLGNRSSSSNSAIDSIAVLPFQNRSSDEAEYLSDGISEALINSLAQLQQLKVVARSTAFRYKGKEVDPQSVGRELNVKAVLMGRIRQVGESLNIQVDLVDTASGAQLWGKEYERNVSDALSVKQTIAREVTDNLKLRLTGDQQEQMTRRDTTNAEAYQFYLRGRFYWNKRTADGLRKALEEFQQAIERDPNYALGHVGLADCHLVSNQYLGVPSSESIPKARAAAGRALQIDDSLAEAHASMANVHQNEWDWARAEEEYKRSISLNPNYPTAHHWFALYYSYRRQFPEALREMKRAYELDSLSPIIGSTLAMIQLFNNDPVSAAEESRKVIGFEPGFPSAHLFLAWAYYQQQHREQAAAEFQKAVELSGRSSFYLADLGAFYALTSKRTEALAILRELEARHGPRESTSTYVAGIYACFGDKDQAFAWLERAFEERSSDLPFMNCWFPFESLRSDPRYVNLRRRIGLGQ